MTARATPATVRRRHKGHFGHEGHFERGAAAVEMALVMPLLILMVMGIIDFSRIFNAELQLSQAAREGARIASLQLGAAVWNVPAIKARAVLAAPNPAFGAPLDTNKVYVDTQCPTTPVATDVAKVRVEYVFNGIFWMNGSTLSQTAVMRCAG